MTKFLEDINGFVWGAPALVLILGVGLYLSVRTGFPQVTLRSVWKGRRRGALQD